MIEYSSDGVETLSEFFHLLHLEGHIGVSPTALQRLRVQMEGRGLSVRRLQVLRVIHNFAIKRSDSSTAAERLFVRHFPDLFEYIVERMGELPLPRKARKTARSRIAEFTSCPGLSG